MPPPDPGNPCSFSVMERESDDYDDVFEGEEEDEESEDPSSRGESPMVRGEYIRIGKVP